MNIFGTYLPLWNLGIVIAAAVLGALIAYAVLKDDKSQLPRQYGQLFDTED